MKTLLRSCTRYAVPALALTTSLALAPFAARAADHGDAPTVDQDSGADLADVFIFLDPNDNTKAIIAMTVHGFIIPGEANNFATFDPNVQYVFELENTGDAKVDKKIRVKFSEKQDSSAPQTATVKGPGFKFTAPTTPTTLAATPNAQVITPDPATGISFFAGEVDDPFFFDLVGFNRFVASAKAGAPNVAFFQRGRDTFAGYNVLAIALSVPVEMVRGTASTVGVVARTRRKTQTSNVTDGGIITEGQFQFVDRIGNPAVNVALIPFLKKDSYNISTTEDDAAGKFVPDILASLKVFGTDTAHVNALAGIAVTNGDFLRVNLSIANSGPKGGTNAEAGFPNGRRLADDTIDTILTVINNGSALGDNVNASDVAPQDKFPFFALPHQPLDAGTTDDNTRN